MDPRKEGLAERPPEGESSSLITGHWSWRPPAREKYEPESRRTLVRAEPYTSNRFPFELRHLLTSDVPRLIPLRQRDLPQHVVHRTLCVDCIGQRPSLLGLVVALLMGPHVADHAHEVFICHNVFSASALLATCRMINIFAYIAFDSPANQRSLSLTIVGHRLGAFKYTTCTIQKSFWFFLSVIRPESV